MPPPEVNFDIEQGTTFVRTVQFLDSAQNPVNITGYTAKMDIRQAKFNTSYLILSLTTSAGITIPNPSNGTFVIRINANQSTGWTQGFYDLMITAPDGTVTKLLKGAVNLNPTVTA